MRDQPLGRLDQYSSWASAFTVLPCIYKSCVCASQATFLRVIKYEVLVRAFLIIYGNARTATLIMHIAALMQIARSRRKP